MAISGRHPRSVPAAVKTVLAPDLSLRGGRRPTWQSREGTPDPYRPPLKQCWPPDLSLRGAKRRGNLGKALPFGTSHRKNGTHLRFVIARRPEADVAISGRHCRSERAIVKRYTPPICHCEERSDVAISGRHPRSVLVAVKTVLAPRFVIARSEATWQSREGTPDPYWPPLKQCWPPDLSLRGGRRPTWQSRSTRSDNRKASANSTPRKAVKA